VSALIHPPSGKMNSQYFARTEFSEVAPVWYTEAGRAVMLLSNTP